MDVILGNILQIVRDKLVILLFEHHQNQVPKNLDTYLNYLDAFSF